MFRFIETISFRDGNLQNLPYHNDRIRKTRGAFFNDHSDIKIEEHINPPDVHNGIRLKCRMTYGRSIEKIEFLPYEPRIVKSLKVVRDNSIIYSYKYHDRRWLNYLFDQRGSCDDILIVKNGLITDSYVANIVLFDGQRWITPSSPLLKGTCRSELIDRGIIREKDVRLEDLNKYRKLRLINAMIPFEESKDIEIGNIVL